MELQRSTLFTASFSQGFLEMDPCLFSSTSQSLNSLNVPLGHLSHPGPTTMDCSSCPWLSPPLMFQGPSYNMASRMKNQTPEYWVQSASHLSSWICPVHVKLKCRQSRHLYHIITHMSTYLKTNFAYISVDSILLVLAFFSWQDFLTFAIMCLSSFDCEFKSCWIRIWS